MNLALPDGDVLKCRKATMSTCSGNVLREGIIWYCEKCGKSSTSWSTKHSPLLNPAQHFVTALLSLARSVDANTASSLS